MSLEQRLDEVIKHVCAVYEQPKTTNSFFFSILQMNSSNLSRWLEKGSVPKDPLKMLEDQFGINPNWVQNGEGVMLLPSATTIKAPKLNILEKLTEAQSETLGYQRRENAFQADKLATYEAALKDVKAVTINAPIFNEFSLQTRALLDRL